MHIISQLRLSTFDGGKSYSAEIKLGDQFYGVTPGAVKTIIAEHKRLGGVMVKFPARSVTIKNAARAAAYGKKVGDTVTVTDYASRTMAFDAVVGDGVIDGPIANVELVTLTISGADLDLGEVKEVTVAVAKPAAAAAAVPSDDDIA